MKFLDTDIPAEAAEALTRASRLGCLFCGHSPHTRKTELEKLTAEGADITTYVEIIEWKHKDTILSEILPKDRHLDLDKDIDCLFERYHHWICSICGYFARKEEDYSFYHAYAGVPSDKRGLVYKDSPDDCMQLVASILEATSKKLELLFKSKERQKKIEIHIDRELGIYRNINQRDIFYPRLRPSSNIFKTILFLVEESNPVDINVLAQHTNQKQKSVKRAIGIFNQNCKRLFDIKIDLIGVTGNGIYFANKKAFDFL